MGLDVTDERIVAAAARLRGDGWAFSERQLYYAVCAEVETPPVRVASSEIGLGLVLILVGIIISQRVVLAVLGGLGLLLVALGAITRVQERRPPPLGRLLALSHDEFQSRLTATRSVLEGLIDDSALPATSGSVVVVCDRPETAVVVAANRARIGDIEVVARDSAPTALHGRRLVVLHDCDPAGCALAADLRDRGAEPFDAGLAPREVMGLRTQLIEGAPARLPRDLSAHLDGAEIDWLRSGRRVELATSSPEEIALRVRACLSPGQLPQ